MAQTERSNLWRHRDFLRLWSALTISKFGSEITYLALPLTAILLLDASAAQVGFMVGLGTLPYLLIGLPAGVSVDRLPRQRILVTADVVRALALLTIPIAAFIDLLTMTQLYLVAVTLGIYTVFFDVTEEAFLPTLIGRESLVEGYSKIAASGSVVEIAGPGIAGGLLQVLSAPFVLLIDAVTFGVSGLLLGSIDVDEPQTIDRGKPREGMAQFNAELMEGLRYVLQHELVRPMVATASTLQLFGGVFDALLILHLVEDIGMSPGLIGVLYMSGSISGLLAAAVAEPVIKRFGIGRIHVLSGFLIGAGMLTVALANGSVLTVAVIVVLAWLVQGIGNTWFNITYSSIIQGTTPDQLLGRVNASERFIGMGALPIGSFVGGLLAVQFGVHRTLIAAGIGAVLAFLWILLSPLPQTTEITTD